MWQLILVYLSSINDRDTLMVKVFPIRQQCRASSHIFNTCFPCPKSPRPSHKQLVSVWSLEATDIIQTNEPCTVPCPPCLSRESVRKTLTQASLSPVFVASLWGPACHPHPFLGDNLFSLAVASVTYVNISDNYNPVGIMDRDANRVMNIGPRAANGAK